MAVRDTLRGSFGTSWSTAWTQAVSEVVPYNLYYFGRGRTHGAIANKKRLKRKGKR
jgi:hypothetical protein